MIAIVVKLLLALQVATALEPIRTSITVTNLGSRKSGSYQVRCRLEQNGSDLHSWDLSLMVNHQILPSKIFNSETIEAETILLQYHDLCNPAVIHCRHNNQITSKLQPFLIDSAQFRCISEAQDNLHCEFPNGCHHHYDPRHKLDFSLAMLTMLGESKCALDRQRVGRPSGHITFDSRRHEQSCVYMPGHPETTFLLTVNAGTEGHTQLRFEIPNYDVVRPDVPANLVVTQLNPESVLVEWASRRHLRSLDRSFQYEFQLNRTRHGELVERRHTIFHHQVNHLRPNEGYELRIRLRVVPEVERDFDEQYWSEWGAVEFRMAG